MKSHILYFFVGLLLLLNGCAGKEQLGTSVVLPAEEEPAINFAEKYSVSKSKNPDRIKYIERFNNRAGENEVGGQSESVVSSQGKLAVEYRKGDAIAGVGLSLALNYVIPPGQKGYWKTELNNLDISQAKVFSLWIKPTNAEDVNYISISLHDGADNVAELAIDSFFTENKAREGWQEVLIPIGELAGIDLNDLKELRVILEALDDGALKGEILLDTIAFLGEEHIFFLSIKDNLIGFPKELLDETRRRNISKQSDEALLNSIAADTWEFFENAIDKQSYLPLDTLKTDAPPWIGDYTSPTNIGLYLMCCVGAVDLGIISENKARGRISKCLDTVEKLEKWEGFLLNFYNTTTLRPTSTIVSTVDCAWFAAGLIVLKNSFEGYFSDRAERLLKQMDFGKLYNEQLGHFRHGFEVNKNEGTQYHYGIFCTEARIASVIAIARGAVPQEHWFRMYRALPSDWTWQRQVPCGSEKEYLGETYFQGYYRYKGVQNVVPSWGGSLFEFLMPTLVVNEKKLAASSLGVNNSRAVRIHIDHALNEKRYPVWGISPCSVPGKHFGGYAEYGVTDIGIKGYPEEGVITPHASILALDIYPKEVLLNLRTMLSNYPMYGEYGFYDAVDVSKNLISYRYLALDQGMIFLSLVNYLKDGAIQKRFHNEPDISDLDELLSLEVFH